MQCVDLKRRQFITLLGGAAAWPLAAHAQGAGKPAPRVGVLLYGTAETDPNYGSFRRGLRELGYVENRSIVLEPRYAESKPERLPLLARELVAAKPDLIYVLGGDVAPFVRAATSTIPIVMAVSNDPVQANLVASLARPGGNITGVTFVSSDLAAKRLQFLHELEPGGSLDRNVGGAGAVQDLVHMRRRAPRDLVEVGTVAQERAFTRPGSPARCEEQPVAVSKGDDAVAVQGHQARRHRYKRLCADAQRGLIRTLEVSLRPRLQ